MAATKVIIRYHRLDDVTIRVVLTNPDATAYDLTGADLRMLIKANKTDADGIALVTKNISETPSGTDGAIVLPATLGLADFFVLDTEMTTVGLETDKPPVQSFVGVKLKTAGGLYHTLVDGFVRLRQELMASGF